MSVGIKPVTAVERLKKFKDELVIRERKAEIYRGGEELFALRPTEFHEVAKTRKDINLIDQLYSLYVDVDTSFIAWSLLSWGDLSDKIGGMVEVVTAYDLRVKKVGESMLLDVIVGSKCQI